MNFSKDVVIERPVEEVFAFLSDPANEVQWQSGLVESRATSAGPIGVGTTGRDVRRFMGRKIVTTWEVTEFEPNRSFSFRVVEGPMPFESAYRFEPVDAGTRVTIEAEAETKGIAKLFEGIVARTADRQYGQNFARLKALLESRP